MMYHNFSKDRFKKPQRFLLWDAISSLPLPSSLPAHLPLSVYSMATDIHFSPSQSIMPCVTWTDITNASFHSYLTDDNLLTDIPVLKCLFTSLFKFTSVVCVFGCLFEPTYMSRWLQKFCSSFDFVSVLALWCIFQQIWSVIQGRQVSCLMFLILG